MYKVVDEVAIEATHAVPLASGELEEPHGHRWRFRVQLESPVLDHQERGHGSVYH